MTRQGDTTQMPRRAPGLPSQWRPEVYGDAQANNKPQAASSALVWDAAPSARGIPEVAARAHRDTVLRRSLVAADVVAAYVAMFVVLLLVPGQEVVSPLPTVLMIAPFVVLASKAIGLYDRDQHILRKTSIDEIPSVLNLSVLYALTIWLTEELLFRGFLSRPQVLALVLMSFVALFVARTACRALAAAIIPPERCLVLGDARDAAHIASKLEASAGVNAVVSGRVPLCPEDDHGGPHPRLRTLADPDWLTEVIAAQGVDRVIIAPGDHNQEEILHTIRLIKALGVKVSVLPRLLEVVGSSSTFEDVDGLALLGLRQYGISKSSGALKRLVDVAGSGVGLLLLAPLLALLAFAIKLDSRGPVFFRQRRIGRKGDVFSMFKFRSMVADADSIKSGLRDRNEAQGGLFKISDDPRITRVGRFLRRTSLDELPQLFNVLGGSMSLVGPRPLVQDEDALIEGWERRRLVVKPGMTGMWQIYGSSRVPMKEMVKIDYLYGANWSLWLDLKILLRTVPYILRRRGL
jgi:exopolysaccharide biosynthesis polyprenyl glycosylphosphotransferase